MSAALRLIDNHHGASFRPSMRPTLVPSPPSSCPVTLSPTSTRGRRYSEAPSTQRSATVHPRFEAAARQEAQNLLAVMRLNADFLGSLITGNASSVALDTLEDLQRGIDRLEQRIASSVSILPR